MPTWNGMMNIQTKPIASEAAQNSAGDGLPARTALAAMATAPHAEQRRPVGHAIGRPCRGDGADDLHRKARRDDEADRLPVDAVAGAQRLEECP